MRSHDAILSTEFQSICSSKSKGVYYSLDGHAILFSNQCLIIRIKLK